MPDLEQRMTAESLRAFFAREFPQSTTQIDAVGPGWARVRQRVAAAHLRPGGTVSGPVMMALADNAMYTALLATIGPVALAVTTNLSINFLRKPDPAHDVIAEGRLLKLGTRLAVGEIVLYSESSPEPVAHATATYSIPPRR